MNESGWLIEDHDHFPRHRWLRVIRSDHSKAHASAKAYIDWTEDANLATRFARREDAINFAFLFPLECTLALITSHTFGLGSEDAPQS